MGTLWTYYENIFSQHLYFLSIRATLRLLPDAHSGVPEASLAVVAAGVGGVTVRILQLNLRHLGVHAVQLRHAVLPHVLK